MKRKFISQIFFGGKDTLIGIFIVCISLVIAICSILWVITVSRCPNCNLSSGGPANRYLHRVDACSNCGTPCWVCPTIPAQHSHKKFCEHCQSWYFDCPPDENGVVKTDAPLHQEGLCGDVVSDNNLPVDLSDR